MRARGEAACTAEPEASITVLKVLPSTAVPETGKSNPGENITANPDMRAARYREKRAVLLRLG